MRRYNSDDGDGSRVRRSRWAGGPAGAKSPAGDASTSRETAKTGCRIPPGQG